MSIEKLKRAIRKIEKRIKTVGKRYETAKQELYKLENRDLFQAKKALRGKKIDEFLKKLLKDDAGLKDVFELRHRIVEIVRQLKSRDITVRLQKKLKKERSDLIIELRRKCSHKLAVQFVGYDSYSSHEDPIYPIRICLICGESETGIFRPLPSKKYKIIKEALWKTGNKNFVDDCRFKDALWISLKKLIKLVKDRV